jgi:trehalose 6-phosphate synthase
LTVSDGDEHADTETTMPLKREPTPPGAITDLFDRLHELHLDAGEPGVRQIATGIGRGVVSYTTVHNVFRGPKVPKWGHLELVVDQLGGDTETFRTLWRSARQAELTTAVTTGPTSKLSSPDTNDHAVLAVQPVHVDERFDFVMVSSRLPLHEHGAPRDDLRTGVERTLHELVQDRRGVWVGRPRDENGQHGLERLPNGTPLLRLPLSDREIELYMEGFCNSTLWPLYHHAIERPEYQRDWHEAYRLVNQRYAEAVDQVTERGGAVWIHDYQLQLVPALLRERRPDLRMGFFLHIPLPPPELFMQLPRRDAILRGLLGADLVGFQRPASARNFLLLCAEVLGLRVGSSSVHLDGRTVLVDTYPVSVDVDMIEHTVGQTRTRRRAQQIRAELGNPEVLVAGLDRLDYTKGIEQRLRAYGAILDDTRSVTHSLAFIQVSPVGRERVARYAKLRERVDRLAGHLNASHGRMGSPVVRYTNQRIGFDEIMALYRAADVMVATSLSDGMNLVAKEYIASRIDNRGALVLSEFTGAAAELDEAILVNPNDADELKQAILHAITMTPTEQNRRMKAMRDRLRIHDSRAWADSFMTSLDSVAPIRR